MAGGWGNPDGGAPGQGITPEQLRQYQTLMRILNLRGTGGMPGMQQQAMTPGQLGGAQGTQNLVNQLQGAGQQGLMGQLMQNPELLRYLMGMQGQQQFPQSGGGVDLGVMMQALGFPMR